MAQKTSHGFSYPEQSDTPDVVRDIAQLANDVERYAAGRDMARGTYTGTTDSSGNLMIPHTLGAKPAVVLLTASTGGAAIVVTYYSAGTTASQIQAVCYKADGTRYASTSTTVQWAAWKSVG